MNMHTNTSRREADERSNLTLFGTDSVVSSSELRLGSKFYNKNKLGRIIAKKPQIHHNQPFPLLKGQLGHIYQGPFQV